MNYKDFQNTLILDAPHDKWSDILKAMWYDANENWDTAHDLVDGMNDALAKWVHAYLHRKEGDEWNAGYWYRQAGRSFPKQSLEEEHQEIVEFILNQ